MNVGIILIELVDTILYATAAGIGISIVFSVAIYGAVKCADFENEDRHIASVAAGLVAAVAFLGCMAAAAASIALMVK